MDKITFDFETNEVTIESSHSNNGILIQPELQDRKEAILEAAGLEIISGEELRANINDLLKEMGYDNVSCAEPSDYE